MAANGESELVRCGVGGFPGAARRTKRVKAAILHGRGTRAEHRCCSAAGRRRLPPPGARAAPQSLFCSLVAALVAGWASLVLAATPSCATSPTSRCCSAGAERRAAQRAAGAPACCARRCGHRLRAGLSLPPRRPAALAVGNVSHITCVPCAWHPSCRTSRECSWRLCATAAWRPRVPLQRRTAFPRWVGLSRMHVSRNLASAALVCAACKAGWCVGVDAGQRQRTFPCT